MRFKTVFSALMLTCFAVAVQTTTSKSYWLLARSDGVWCGYANALEFKSEAAKLRPGESARVTYSSGRLAEVTYQVEPESADWVVVDKYTPAGDSILLRRANLLVQQNLTVIEETTIRAGKMSPFRILHVTTLTGKKAQAPPNLDMPDVPVSTDLSGLPFMKIVAEMRSRSLAKLCSKSQ